MGRHIQKEYRLQEQEFGALRGGQLCRNLFRGIFLTMTVFYFPTVIYGKKHVHYAQQI